MTLRITVERLAERKVRLRLEGRFAVADLAVFDDCLDELRELALELDLAELRWVAAPAVERIAELLRGGSRIVASSPFLDRLLVECLPDSRSVDASATPCDDPRSPMR